MTQQIDWNGLIPATVLPFSEDGSMDEASQRRLIDRLANIDARGDGPPVPPRAAARTMEPIQDAHRSAGRT